MNNLNMVHEKNSDTVKRMTEICLEKPKKQSDSI